MKQTVLTRFSSVCRICPNMRLLKNPRRNNRDMKKRSMQLDDIDIKIDLGNLVINVLWLRTAGFDSSTHIKSHYHSCYELHMIPYGNGVLNVNNTSYNISPGVIYLTGPLVYHEQISDPLNPMEEYCINFELSLKNNTKTTNDELIISNILSKSKFWFGSDEHGLCSLFEMLIDEFNNKYLGYYISVKNYLYQIFTKFARCLATEPHSTFALPQKNIDDKRRVIIDEYFNISTRKLTLLELSQNVGLSIRQLERMMIKYYGMSFNRKITEIKMIKAATLLKSTNHSIKKISLALDIEDPAYFSRIFRKHWGISPLKFRQS